MRLSKRLAVLLSGVLFSSMMGGMVSDASAESYKLYLRGAVGMNYTQGMEYDINSGEILNTYQHGYLSYAAFGADFDEYSLEVEGAFRGNSIKDQTLAGTPLPSNTGKTTSLSLMVNGYYITPSDGDWHPYVGIGMGYAEVHAKDHKSAATTLLDDGNGAFAYQGMVGILYDMTDSLSLFGEYKYFATMGVPITTVTNTTHELDYENHGATVGLKYHFK